MAKKYTNWEKQAIKNIAKGAFAALDRKDKLAEKIANVRASIDDKVNALQKEIDAQDAIIASLDESAAAFTKGAKVLDLVVRSFSTSEDGKRKTATITFVGDVSVDEDKTVENITDGGENHTPETVEVENLEEVDNEESADNDAEPDGDNSDGFEMEDTENDENLDPFAD